MSDTTPPADGQVPPPAAGGQIPPQYAPPAPVPAAPYTAAGDQQLAAWAHLSTIAWYWPGPLIIWLVGKDRGQKTNIEAKEALNYGITAIIAWLAVEIVFFWVLGWIPVLGFILAVIGWLAQVAIFVVTIVWAIQGFQRVNAGGSWRYPFNFRFIK